MEREVKIRMTTELELKEKLGRWAGLEATPMEQIRFDHSTKLLDVYPNFPHSLDACFRYLVPLARKKFGKKFIDRLVVWATINCWASSKPALSLCEIIEKLIDEGKE